MTPQTPGGRLGAEDNALLEAYLADHFPNGGGEEAVQRGSAPEREGDGWADRYVAESFGSSASS